MLSRWSLVRDDAGRPKSVFVIDTDITERKKLEAQLYRAQRLESIGQLASGIAHDLNNILAPLVMVAPLLRMEIKAPETLRLVDILEANTKRGVEVVKQILTFSRGLKAGKGLVPLRPLLKEVINVLDETFPKSIALRSSIPEDLWMVEGDATQLHQVLMNLSVNARDAMPDGGTLTLAAENMVVDELYASMSPGAKPGPYVVWLVADTGTGIPPEDLDRIFDPFFTTKEPGKGTGLGLSTALGIVRNHGGFLKVESKPGKGTQFRVYLPAQMGAQLPAEPPPTEAPPEGRGETILVVDDEEGVRVLTKKVLEQHGYHVLLASEGSEAVVAYAQHATEIHAVLTDLMMPLMDGATLIRALKQIAPAVKILATTGVTESTHDAAALRLGAREVLRKPYPPHVLLSRLRAALDEPEDAK
jgi:nitrogen-specific signal transduction histidine kinase/CheY-like chemotaxis protein